MHHTPTGPAASAPADTLRLTAKMDSLAPLRDFVLDIAPPPLAPKLDLILEELLVNVFSYAYPDGDGEVSVTRFLDQRASPPVFTLILEDWGEPFHPLQKEDPDLDVDIEERGVGGLGIYFVKEMADEVHYARVDGANRLTLRLSAKVDD